MEPVGPNGEIIMDYSIDDALEAGFNDIVFIIRKDLEKDFREVIGDRIVQKAKVSYAFQEMERSAGRISETGRKKKTVGNRTGDFGLQKYHQKSVCGDQCR